MNSIYKLEKGKQYRVTKEFTDYDFTCHAVGETWEFTEIDYVAYHDGLSLFVIENGHRTQYRFQNIPEEQQHLIETFMDYVELV